MTFPEAVLELLNDRRIARTSYLGAWLLDIHNGHLAIVHNPLSLAAHQGLTKDDIAADDWFSIPRDFKDQVDEIHQLLNGGGIP